MFKKQLRPEEKWVLSTPSVPLKPPTLSIDPIPTFPMFSIDTGSVDAKLFPSDNSVKKQSH
eukprot:1464193-Rhodomonas_salina.1